MASRRMFSADIVESEEFLDMPHSSQSLYFHLGMKADDDGFVQPRLIMKLIGANVDDLKVLLSKRFLLTFDGGVVVIKHWLIHNLIRKDRYKESRFIKEKSQLYLKDNNVYTDSNNKGKRLLATKWQPNDNQMAPQVRLGKARIVKREKSISFLKELKKEDLADIRKEYGLSEKIIKDMAESVVLYCESKPKKYANYRSALKNWLRREFKEEIEKFKAGGGKKIKEWKPVEGGDGSIAMKPIYE